ncbi:MAG: hypothetical protein J6X56_08950 [Ruminococcus sp.]|uniref:hypothetical protein n=1 Tax=Ruminococcus sp. TaxID=41978 RepID=UPI001B67BAF0|nr:hypothetical protein [Ruminococcus sp.]MBP5579584.1 hypothetical protein [Ruminococcus sp.]
MITVKTKPSRESINRLFRVTAPPKRTIAAFAVLLLIMLTALVMSILYYKKGRGDLIFVVCGTVLVCAAVIFMVRILRYPARRFRVLQKTAPDMVQSFAFSEESCSVRTECTGISSHSEQSYGTVRRAVYKEGWFVLIFGSGSGISFHENSFTQGAPQQLSAILREKLGRKYRVK